MRFTRRNLIGWFGGMILASPTLSLIQQRAVAQSAANMMDTNPTDYQDIQSAFVKALVPRDDDLQGILRQSFRQVQPAGSLGASYLDQFVAKPIPDILQLNVELTKTPMNRLNKGRVSSLLRSFTSSDTFWGIEIHLHSCDSVETAQRYIKEATSMTQAAWRKGTVLNSVPIGDESWIVGGNPRDNALWFRYGAVVTRIYANPTGSLGAYGMTVQMPPSVVEGVAHLILLRLARESLLSSHWQDHGPLGPAKSDWSVPLRVNGELLPSHACQQVGKQIYVPVLPFVDAAHQDLQARWEAAVGALMLLNSPYSALTLATGSTIVIEGLQTKATLKVPLFKDGNQPYMALQDLLSLLPRSKAEPEGDGFSVKVSAI